MILPGHGAAVDEDERFCQSLTRREASNFYWGFIALPKRQRLAIYALYSFARQVDDEIDLAQKRGDGSRPDVGCAVHRDRLTACYGGEPCDPVMRVLSRVVREYDIPREELEALIDGVEMDIRLTRYLTWPELQEYCRHVASAVGRMCVRIFGFTDRAALDRADDLGVALQLANILRDVREDAALGRVYLPLEDLLRFDVTDQQLVEGHPGPGWEPLVRFEIARSRGLFDSGLLVTHMIPRRSAVCVNTMAGIYAAIVDEIEHDPYLPLKRRASLGGKEKLAIMLKSWLQAV
jgi:15-cis-phytoene synthase